VAKEIGNKKCISIQLNNWQHNHEFSVNSEKGEKRIQYVLVLTAVSMVVEIIAGSIYGYMALLADAMASLLAIVALLSGKYFGWNWLDPVMGMVGAIIIARWSYGLLRQTSPILLDASIEEEYQQAIKESIEKDSDNRISDIHVWNVGANHYAAIIVLVTHYPNSTEHYKGLLRKFHKLSHVTIEVNECKDAPCIVPNTNIAKKLS